MIECYVKGLDLLSLVNLNPELEPVPEPFRLQSSVLFRVTFQDYSEFIKSLPCDVSSIQLAGNLQATQQFARLDSPLLYNCFLRDLAFSIGKELSFAEKYKSVGTFILPTSQTAVTLDGTRLASMFNESCQQSQAEFCEIISSYGFRLTTAISQKNCTAYRLASCLYHLSKQNLQCEYNFHFDIRGK